MLTAIKGNLILPDRIVYDGTVTVRGGRIVGIMSGCESVSADKTLDLSGKYIAPGFVDIHCHGSPSVMGHDDPAAAAEAHYAHGTTAMLLSLYRNLSFDQTMSALGRIEAAMATQKNIIGVHMEGPYLNPNLGSKAAGAMKINPSEYRRIMQTGIVKQWTFSPEIEGSIAFCKEIAAAGIVPAIGHSRAGIEAVRAAAEAGATIVTHLMDATGTSISPSRYAGTKEVDFDSACILEDGFYYEIIHDKDGIHVRHDMIRLVIKTVGIDRIIGITDCYAGTDNGSDVNIFEGELTGSKLTMDNVARNFLNIGLSLTDVCKAVSLNPAKAIGMENELGQIRPGCRSDLLVTDEALHKIEVLEL